jgi:3-phenylpropionate/cinnamic acid dioxygenase small subunit
LQCQGELEPSILYDNADQREQRIYQLTRLPHYAQMPPSRTIHNVSNVRVVTPNGSEAVVVQCNLNVVELRPGDHQELQAGLGEQRTLAGQSVYHLRQDNDGWRIALKKVVLIDRDLPIFNFSFIL